MIHFDFIVTDEEAELIFSLISDEIFRSEDVVMMELGRFTAVTKEWHRIRIPYLKNLKEKMTNSKVS